MNVFASRSFSALALAGVLALHTLACGDDTATPGTGGQGGGTSSSGSTASGAGTSSSGTTSSGSSSTSEGAGAGGEGGQGGDGQGGDGGDGGDAGPGGGGGEGGAGDGGAGGASTVGAEAVARCEAFNDFMNDLEIELGCDEDETYYNCGPMANDVELNDCLDDVVAYFDCSTQLIEANVEACACNDANDEVRCDLEDEFELECAEESEAFVACVGGPET